MGIAARPGHIGTTSAFQPEQPRIRRNAPSMALALLFTALPGCVVGPDYQAPPVVPPGQWSQAAIDAPGAGKPAADLPLWWRGFKDERLNRLVEMAIQGNPDLKIADARLGAARARRLSAEAAFWPSVDASASYERMRISPNAVKGLLGSFGNGIRSGAETSTLLSGLGPLGTPFSLFQTGFDASWELDLFGGIQRRREAAEADYAALREAQRDVLVSLTAEVARNYLGLISLERRLRIAGEQVENRREILRLAENAYHEGFATALDPIQARAGLEAAEAVPPALAAQIGQTRHALAILLGQPPAAMEHRLANLGTELPAPPAIPAGLPSDMLRRRPDLRRAERETAEAAAMVGVAVAELFPKLSLTGSVGFQSQELSNFTSLSSGFYGFGPRLSLPIFQAGRLIANVDQQESKFAEALRIYDKSILAALREVEDALSSLNGEYQRKTALATAEATARQAIGTAKTLYAEGETGFQSVLEAQRAWYEAEENLALSELAWSSAHIALFKALGGGWPMDAGK